MSYSGKYSGVFPTAYNGVFGSGASGGSGIANVFKVTTRVGTSTQTDISTGIDLSDGSSDGGLVMVKSRSQTFSFLWFDTKNVGYYVQSAFTSAKTATNYLNAFNTDGYSIDGGLPTNNVGDTYVDYTFKKAPKFFDVIKYTGNGSSQTIPHELGVQAGFCVVKRLSDLSEWTAQHRSRGTNYLVLNQNYAEQPDLSRWNGTPMNDTDVSVTGILNYSGSDYAMYVFAHDIADDGVIQCGQYVGNGIGSNQVDLETAWSEGIQYLLIKRAVGGNANWVVIDNLRGFNKYLQIDRDLVEIEDTFVESNATGFNVVVTNARVNTNGATYIYIAIRAEA